MSGSDETHDPKRTSWVPSALGHIDFPIQNLPYGIFAPKACAPRAGVAIGDQVLDLSAIANAGLLPPDIAGALSGQTLNALFSLPASTRRALRHRLSELLSDPSYEARLTPHLHPAADCTLHLPATIGDYSDFYVGIHHARTVGSIYRPDTPLQPNYKYLPIGYHGRASSIRPSGTPVVRPNGQILPAGAEVPVYTACRQMDYEMELGIWIGQGNALGTTVPMAEAPDHIAGLCLLNDWSARDIQNWERLPLGPFLAKSFQSSVSPWVVTSEALAPFRIAPMPRDAGDPAPLPYLSDATDATFGQFALTLEVSLLTPAMRAAGQVPHRLSRSHATDMYWTFAQIVAHQASNGVNMAPGDLLGTGTIAGPEKDGAGSLLEITRNGKAPLTLPNGEVRAFLEDGDEVIFTARAEAPGLVSIGFGECRGVVHPAV